MTRYLLAGLTVSLVFATIVVGVRASGAPEPLPSGAPAESFSAERALVTLRTLSAAPRPIGSVDAGAARAHIVAALRGIGLVPRVQSAGVVSARNASIAGTVRNVVARLPGRDSSRTLVLVAHYDSVATAAGAADDASGVAALLETARALAVGPQLRNDVVFLFTDGEERGMLGAQAFLRDAPWAPDAGLVLNLDSPGSSTAVVMYETSPGNGALVRELAHGLPRIRTSSLLNEVSGRFPGETDFRVFVAAGVPGMSLAALDGPAYYHTGYDDIEHYRPGSLQSQGETVLALARRFGALDLREPPRPDVVFFAFAGEVVVYGEQMVVPLVVIAGLLVAAAVAVAARRRLLSVRGFCLSLLAVPGVLGGALLVMALAWGMYRTAYAQRTWSDVGMVISDFYRVGLVLLAVAAVVGAYMVCLRRLQPYELAAAALGWWLLLATGISLTMPGASYLLTWPLVAAALGMLGAALLGRRHSGWPAAMVALLCAMPAVLLLSDAVHLLLMAEGLKQVVTVMVVWLVVGLLVLPLDAVRGAFGLWLPAALSIVGVVVLFAVGAAVAGEAEHPRFTSIHYRVDAAGETSWQTPDPINDWTRQFMGPHPHVLYAASYFPQLGMRQTTVAAAPRIGLETPRVEVLQDTARDGRRTVRLRLTSRRAAPVMSLLLHTVVGQLTAAVDGRPLSGRDTAVLDDTSVRWRFDYYAPPPRGIVVTLRFAAGPSVLLRVVDCSYGIPAGLAGRYEARPLGVLPGGIGDTTLTETVLRLPATGERGAGD